MNRRESDIFAGWFGFPQNTDTNFEGSDPFDSDFESNSRSNRHQTKRRNTRTSRGEVRGMSTSTCQQLANIIGGVVVTETPVCVVQRLRDINATILGLRTQSPLALPFALSFENNGLNLGESVVLQREINPFMTELRKRGLIVTAVHNHWLFENPRLMYMHWENAGDDPFDFATKSFEAAKAAGLFKR